MKKLILLILASLPTLCGHAQSWKADADALVVNQVFEGSTGQKILDLRGLNPGVYTYSLQCEGLISSGKLVIVR